MSEQSHKNNQIFKENSANDQLDEVLGNLDKEIETVNKNDVEKKVFMQKDEFIQKKNKLNKKFKDLEWYWKLIKKPILILFGLQVSVYILSLVPGLKLLMVGVFDPLLLLVDFVFFGWIVAEVKLKNNENLWQALVTVFLGGFTLGILVSILKFFWFREYWTIFNLIAEPVFMGLIAVIVGLVAWVFIRRK